MKKRRRNKLKRGVFSKNVSQLPKLNKKQSNRDIVKEVKKQSKKSSAVNSDPNTDEEIDIAPPPMPPNRLTDVSSSKKDEVKGDGYSTDGTDIIAAETSKTIASIRATANSKMSSRKDFDKDEYDLIDETKKSTGQPINLSFPDADFYDYPQPPPPPRETKLPDDEFLAQDVVLEPLELGEDKPKTKPKPKALSMKKERAKKKSSASKATQIMLAKALANETKSIDLFRAGKELDKTFEIGSEEQLTVKKQVDKEIEDKAKEARTRATNGQIMLATAAAEETQSIEVFRAGKALDKTFEVENEVIKKEKEEAKKKVEKEKAMYELDMQIANTFIPDNSKKKSKGKGKAKAKAKTSEGKGIKFSYDHKTSEKKTASTPAQSRLTERMASLDIYNNKNRNNNRKKRTKNKKGIFN